MAVWVCDGFVWFEIVCYRRWCLCGFAGKGGGDQEILEIFVFPVCGDDFVWLEWCVLLLCGGEVGFDAAVYGEGSMGEGGDEG